ncbi:heterokaryon incompatibility domain-containing protein [Trichoderma austrokoningii]
MTHKMPQYVFSDLKAPKNFRLLKILPGKYEEPLYCTISECQLQNSSAYEALSYAWGVSGALDESRPTMSLNEQEFIISSTLEQALRRLRRLDTARVMWIDRICINQDNTDERNTQVAIMPDIYRGALRVIAWIGEQSYDSGRALAFLKEMAMHHKYIVRHRWMNGARVGSDTSSECGEGKHADDMSPNCFTHDVTQHRMPPFDDKEKSEMKGVTQSELWKKILLNQKQQGHIFTGCPVLYDCSYIPFFKDARQPDWEAVDSLLARLWWSRTWVVQEIWQAKDAILLCGDSSLKWKTFQKAMEYQEAWDDMGCLVQGTKRWEIWATLKSRYGLAIHISQKRLLGSKLSDILWNTWDRDATDPRDKVYAVLGLVGSDYSDTLPSIDYSKSIEEVYREAASLIITKENSLDILLAASGLDNGGKLPSWVPDWRRKANEYRPALFVNASFMRMQCYYAGSADAVYFHGHGYSASGNMELQVKFQDNLGVLQVCAVIFDSIAKVSTDFDSGFSAASITEHARDLIRNSCTSGSLSLDRAISDGELKKTLSAGSFIDTESLRTEEMVIENVMKFRRFSITTNGHLSIGPSKMQTGDLIAIIAGCSFPMVLRSIGSYFSVVGEAYIQNYMAGEILERYPIASSNWIDICII